MVTAAALFLRNLLLQYHPRMAACEEEEVIVKAHLQHENLLGQDPVPLLLQEQLLLILEEDLGVAELEILQLLLLMEHFPQDLLAGLATVHLPGSCSY